MKGFPKKLVVSQCMLGTLLFCACLSSDLFAAGSAGIEIGLDSARAVGKGNTGVADPQDASTLVYNPAGLTTLASNEIAMGTTIIVPDNEYQDLTGLQEEASSNPAYIPSFFVSLNTPIEKLKVGGGVNAPFGLVTQYSSVGNFKYTGIYNEIKSIYYTVDGAYQLAPWLSVGGGISYVDANVKQVAKINSDFITQAFGGPPGMPDANTEFEADGNGYGWNMGILLTPHEKWNVGFFYRSQVKVPLRGDMNVDNLQGPVMQFLFGGESFQTSVDTDITLPDSAVIGVLYKATDKLDVEVDFGWTGWGVFDHFDIDYGTSNPVLDANDPSEHKFADSISVNVGLSYKLDPNWNLMTGYAFFERAALENDYSNVFPDGDRHNITVGLQYHRDNFSIGMSYVAQFVSEVSIDNTVGNISNASVDGEYSGFYHVVVTSITYKFG